MDHLRAAAELGHTPSLLTNGLLFTPEILDEMLELGVRLVSLSVDAIDAGQYAKIRRGGDFDVILEACRQLRARKSRYPDLRVEVNNTLFKTTFPRQAEYVDFWRGKVDQVNFNAEYYDTFKFRNLLTDPGDRVHCQIRTFLVPNGKITPCCAMVVYQHTHETPWLPNVRDMSLEDAQVYLQGLYDDPESPLGKLCQGCDWWIMFKPDAQGNSPYVRYVPLDEAGATDAARQRSRELQAAGGLAQALLRVVTRLF
jgi:sulfatase maturation enzyme AslB (radical SAM superfamily)